MENTYQDWLAHFDGEIDEPDCCIFCGEPIPIEGFCCSDECLEFRWLEADDEEVPRQGAGLLELGGAGSTGRGAVRKVPAPTSDKDAA